MRRALVAALAGLVTSALVQPAGGAATREAEQLPNLVALAPADLEMGEADPGGGEEEPAPVLRFATGAANRGDYALELLGVPDGADNAIAQQCIAWAAPRLCSGWEEVGTFEWHPDHGHHHFQDFALYELRRMTRKGVVNMGARGLVRTSGKVSFCIIDYEEDDAERDSLYSQPHPLYYSCAAGGMQGISPGWRDVYENSLVGQQMPLNGVPDGIYALINYVDPANRLRESNETDNVALVHVAVRAGELAAECEPETGKGTCLPLGPPVP